jgi:hypothetical protein
MTDITETPPTGPVEDIRAQNKKLIFAALAEAGIKTMIVHFDGYGDSGQIESIDAWAKAADDPDIFTAGNSVPIPSNRVLQLVSPNGDTPDETTLQDAIEALVYDYLDETHYGWEDGDGAYGTFVLAIPQQTITLKHNERFIDVNTSTHTF